MITGTVLIRGTLGILMVAGAPAFVVSAKPHAHRVKTAEQRVTIPKPIVAQVFNHPRLQGFLHPTVRGRVPVLLSSHLVDPHLTLYKFGKPAHVVPDSKTKSGAFLRFTNFTVKNKVAMVDIEYKIEGVIGQFKFRRFNRDAWKLVNAKIVET